MKRLFLSLVVLAMAPILSASSFTNEEMIAAASEVQAGNPVAGAMFEGSIGGDSFCFLMMPYGSDTGYYTFLNYSRVLRFGSYNAKTQTLVLNAYEEGTGKYIGKFVGKLTFRNRVFHRYKGVFTNYKGGKVNFNLEEYSPE